jgi:hypothetical protein
MGTSCGAASWATSGFSKLSLAKQGDLSYTFAQLSYAGVVQW